MLTYANGRPVNLADCVIAKCPSGAVVTGDVADMTPDAGQVAVKRPDGIALIFPASVIYHADDAFAAAEDALAKGLLSYSA
jgi:hypothetical protein